MKTTTCKDLQAIGAFVLAGGCTKSRIKQVAEMIRAARNYRWVGIYKIRSDEDDHVQRLASDRGVRFGGRLHEEPNQAGGGNDPRGPQLPVGRHLQNPI